MQMKNQSGFTYLALLFTIAIAGVMLARTGIDWTQSGQREKEHELLFVGNQIRLAITQYYQRTPGTVKFYPKKLDDLLEDTRYNTPQHYLRKIYRDPITNSRQWVLIMSPEGGIMGVHSKSDKPPIKTAGFDHENEAFAGKSKISDWIFTYVATPTVATGSTSK